MKGEIGCQVDEDMFSLLSLIPDMFIVLQVSLD